MRDLLAGRIQFMFATIPSVMPHILAGKLRPIAVSSAKRSRSMPEAVTSALNKAVNEVVAMPAIEQQMIREGADPVGGSPAQFAQFVQCEYEKWKTIVVESGARAD